MSRDTTGRSSTEVTSVVTPLLLTFNEEANVGRTLQQLTWAPEVVVVDSNSTDRTAAIVATFSNTTFLRRDFDDHVGQWTAGVKACRTEWILALDADYHLTDELTREIASLELDSIEPDIDAYFCSFRYLIHGRPLRASLYPPKAVLFRKARCRYVQDGHTQRLEVRGKVRWLKHEILHDDRKAVGRWLADQGRYAVLEARKLRSETTLSLADRIRQRVVLAPFLVFAYLLLWKGLLLDGWPGWVYVCQRTIAELIISLKLAEAKVMQGSQSSNE